MEERSIRIIPFNVERVKWIIWSAKFLSKAGLSGCNIIIKFNVKNPADNAE